MNRHRRRFSGFRAARRSGIALIIVLGFLALLSILVLGLASLVRVERLAAGNYRKTGATTEMLHAALARALEGIDAHMAGRIYPTNDILWTVGTPADEAPNLIAGEATNYVPGALRAPALAVTPGWLTIQTPLGATGHYAYVILNCAGLLDASTVGGSLGRMVGTNVNEILLDGLPEVPSSTTNDFYTYRADHRYYESIQELHALQRGVGLSAWPQTLFHYSHAPIGYMEGGTRRTNLVNLAVPLTTLETPEYGANIVKHLKLSGLADSIVDPVEANASLWFVYTNLLDYVDPDIVPRDLGSGTVESVPMINEVQVEPILQIQTPETLLSVLRVELEWFYPFIAGVPNTFDIYIRAEAVPATNTTAQVIQTSTYLRPNPLEVRINSGYVPNETNRYGRVERYSEPRLGLVYTNLPGTNVSWIVRVGAKVIDTLSSGADVVDSVPYPLTNAAGALLDPFEFTVSFGFSTNTPGAVFSKIAGAEAIDPRYNWNTKETAGQWFAYSPYVEAAIGQQGYAGSIGSANEMLRFWFSELGGNPESDGHTRLHVANRAMRQVGELTYLQRQRALQSKNYWTSIRLFRHRTDPPDRVLDYFTLETNAVFRGKVNPNTRQTNALAAVFYNMPRDDYPDHGIARLSWNQAQSIAGYFIANRNRSFTNVSEIGHVTNLFLHPLLAPLTPFQKESVLRNASGLFNTRQNLFTILLAAQKAEISNAVWIDDGGANAPPGTTLPWLTSVQGDQRAVAIVWRDPFPDAQGRNAFRLHFFKKLSK